ncbi:hypothetical protein [Acetobacter syzygii]|uniref:Uncharacterized protein n=1 Tax=Acetobacter syzygii TaxID=146476 RepID=A0A270B8U7_9PROT|nr:hypothetical protein [Acetobacter syzygii]NSL92717.1 hypothetical protein [Acetobacter syzygii]PAL20576.1 hypothetical protein B9K05_12810 [Acetobacter syzygii]PAL21191.1 hypothetical protein B9K04_12965 [Acetobacter syzygii]
MTDILTFGELAGINKNVRKLAAGTVPAAYYKSAMDQVVALQQANAELQADKERLHREWNDFYDKLNEKYNALVADFNNNLDRENELVDKYNARLDQYNSLVRKYNALVKAPKA